MEIKDLRSRLDALTGPIAQPDETNVLEKEVSLPDRALGVAEIEAACAAARERGWNEGYQEGRRRATARMHEAIRSAGMRGEVFGAVAALEQAAVDLSRLWDDFTDPSADRVRRQVERWQAFAAELVARRSLREDDELDPGWEAAKSAVFGALRDSVRMH